MKKNDHTPSLERIFKITHKDKTIDLRGSLAIVNNKASETAFEKEIYKIAFTTYKQNTINKKYYLFLSASECIPKKEIARLKTKLGIEISGDGSLFQINRYETDFTLQFDQKNSISIDTENVKDGLIYFYKEK